MSKPFLWVGCPGLLPSCDTSGPSPARLQQRNGQSPAEFSSYSNHAIKAFCYAWCCSSRYSVSIGSSVLDLRHSRNSFPHAGLNYSTLRNAYCMIIRESHGYFPCIDRPHTTERSGDMATSTSTAVSIEKKARPSDALKMGRSTPARPWSHSIQQITTGNPIMPDRHYYMQQSPVDYCLFTHVACVVRAADQFWSSAT